MARPRPDAPASAWRPLRSSVFRALWLANFGSFVGTWVHEVGAAWLMTSLSSTPLLVALVQASATLPLFLLVLPAGALADVGDRRRILIAAQLWMLAVALTLGGLAFADLLTPGSLLLLTALLALGTALSAPAWQAILPEVVEPGQLTSAVALQSLSVNTARALGPALGGVIVASAGPAAAFALNAVSFASVTIVLARWRRPRRQSELPAERFLAALRNGLRYVRHAPRLRAVLVRTAAFTLAGSALWALLPLVARAELGLDAGGYGALLGMFGAGAVTAATQLPRLRRRLEADTLVLFASLAFGACLAGLALAPARIWAFAAMPLGGIGWMLLLSSFHVAAQTVLPGWVRARALAAYLLVFFGSLALGSLLWGTIATLFGLRPALAAAGAAAAVTPLLRIRYRLRGGEDLNLAPSRHWPLPPIAADVEPDQGPVMVTVEYFVDPADEPAFRLAMERLRRARQRDGAWYWDLFVDTGNPGRYVEVYLADSWLEHLRQHERVTEEDRLSEAEARRFVRPGHPVRVEHLVSVSSKRDPAR